MRALRPLTLLCLAALLSGCFQTKSLIRLNADGSGTVEETVLMNATMAMTMMAGSGGLFAFDGDDAGEPEVDTSPQVGPLTMAQLEARAVEIGATLQSADPIDIVFGSGYTAVFAFDDINELQLNGNPMGSLEGAMDGQMSGSGGDSPIQFAFANGTLTVQMPRPDPEEEVIEDIDLDLEDLDVDDLDVDDTVGGEEMIDEELMDSDLEFLQEDFDVAEDRETDEDELRQMMLMFKDMTFSLAIELPRAPRQTSASFVQGATVTLFDIDFGRIVQQPGAFDRLDELGGGGPPQFSPEVVEAIQGIDGFTFEPAEEVSISF